MPVPWLKALKAGVQSVLAIVGAGEAGFTKATSRGQLKQSRDLS